MKESWPKMFCRQCRQNVLRHVCYSKSSNKLEAEHRLLEMDHKNRMSINWLHTVCRPWAGQSAQRHGKSLQSCPILCDPMDCSPPGSSAHGILQAKILEWVVTPSSRGSSWPRDRTCVSLSLSSPTLVGIFLTTEPPGKPQWFSTEVKYSPLRTIGNFWKHFDYHTQVVGSYWPL